MGGDGGSISKRSEMVKTKKKAVLEDPSVEEHNRWACCSISSQPLRSPTVVCALGNLYNRQAAVDYLLLMKQLPKGKEPPYNLAHIRSLKHIWNAKLHFDDKAKIADPKAIVFFSCPITGLPGNGKFRFIHMTKCGCVLAEKAYQQVPSSSCLSCGAKLSKTLDFSNTTPTTDANAAALEDKKDNINEEKKAVPPSSSSSSSSSSASSRLVEERARLDAEQSARDAADAAAAPDPNAVEWTYICPPSERLKVMRRQLIAKCEAEMAADAEARRNKKAAKKNAAIVTSTSITVSSSTVTTTSSSSSDVGGIGGTKRPRGVSDSSSTSDNDEIKTNNNGSSDTNKKKRKADVPRPPANVTSNVTTKPKKQSSSSSSVSSSSKGGVKTLLEGRSEVFKSLFLPKDAHLRPSVPNFTSTKPASAMPALL